MKRKSKFLIISHKPTHICFMLETMVSGSETSLFLMALGMLNLGNSLVSDAETSLILMVWVCKTLEIAWFLMLKPAQFWSEETICA